MPVDILDIVNAIRNEGSTEYNERVPAATQLNITEVGAPILQYQGLTNEFLSALLNKIVLTEVTNKRWENPLAVLKKGTLPLGMDFELVHANPASAAAYAEDGSDLLNVAKPDVVTEYFRRNRQDKYKVSISHMKLREAFTNWDNLGQLVTAIINTLYTGDNLDEFILMKNLFADAVTSGKIVTAETPAVVDQATGTQMVKALKNLQSGFKYPSSLFNAYTKLNPTGTPRITYCNPQDVTLIIREDILNAIDVDVLAHAFNLGKSEFLAKTLMVDNFGAAADCQAVIMDESVIQVRDNLIEMRQFENGANMIWSYWLHHWQTYGLSTLGNAVAVLSPVVAP